MTSFLAGIARRDARLSISPVAHAHVHQPGDPDHHHADHAHAHAGHSHDHRDAPLRRLIAALAVTVIYLIAEAIGAWWSQSLALYADAGHMLSDAAALALSVFAAWFARRPPTARHTFGFHRGEILAALLNGATLIAIAILILIEAVRRLRSPTDVDGPVMIAVAVGGLIANLICLWILRGRGDAHHNLNMRGAWLHVLFDAIGSIGAILAGLGMVLAGWQWVDPVASMAIAGLIVWSSWALVGAAASVLMEASPPGVDVDAIRRALTAVAGVDSVHDLHVWSIGSGRVSLSAHIVGRDDAQVLLQRVRTCLHQSFAIEHATIQVEREDQQHNEQVC